MNILAQIIGILAMGASIISFQLNTKKNMMIAQLVCAVLFAIHFGMLGAATGAAVNLVAIVRNIIFYNKDKKFFSGNIWTAIFVIINITVGVVFWESKVSALSIIGMVLNTISLSLKEPQKVRIVMLASSPFVLIYSALTGSIGGFVNELISEASMITALIRYRKNK